MSNGSDLVAIPTHFREREDLKAAALLSLNALVILAAGPVAHHIGQWWAYALAFILVGARGQACYILQHELMHNLLFTQRKTNIAVGMLVSAMLGTRYFMAQRLHMEHHRLLSKPGDPNVFFHDVSSREPGWPAVRFFAFHLLGGRLLMLAQGLIGAVIPIKGASVYQTVVPAPLNHDRCDLASLVVVQLIILTGITLTSSFWVYVFLYVLPLSTLTAFFEVIRSFSEHVAPGHDSDSTPERKFYMKGGAVELFFVSQFDFHFHHVHHLYPNVVTFKVRKLDEWLTQNDPHYRDRFGVRPGYVRTALNYIANRPIPGSGRGYPLGFME